MATRRARRQPTADDAARRGALVTGAAVAVGALILTSISGRPGPHVVSATSATTTTSPPPTVTTPVTVLHPPESVTVLVLNAVDPKKSIAKPAAATVAAAGFTTAPAHDAPALVPKSIVYFVPGYEADAKTVAAFLSIPPAAVIPLPTPTPPTVGDPGGAQVVALIGPDAPAASG